MGPRSRLLQQRRYAYRVGVRLALFINAGSSAKKVFRVTGTKAILRVRTYGPGSASDPRPTPGAGGMY